MEFPNVRVLVYGDGRACGVGVMHGRDAWAMSLIEYGFWIDISPEGRGSVVRVIGRVRWRRRRRDARARHSLVDDDDDGVGDSGGGVRWWW